MQTFLYRFAHAPDYTCGIYFAFDKCYPDAFILEDEYRDIKVPGETRIPAGWYKIVFNKQLTPLTIKYREKYSWFTWHIMLENVKGFTGVYMHIGNTDENTDACLLMGDICDITPPTPDGLITESTASFRRFYQRISPILDAETEDVYINIIDLQNCHELKTP